jgi:uncharacterized membrane protein YccC
VNTRTAFWKALTRFESGKIVPEIAIRNAVGFVAAVVIVTVLGSPSAGVVAGTGALNVSYSDSRDPYPLRARRMMISALLGTIAVTVGALAGHSNVVAVLVAMLWAFASGMLVALGTTAADLGVITLVTLVVFAARPLAPLLALRTGMTAFGGAMLQVLLSIAPWPWRRYEPERRIVASLYAALSGMARAPGLPSKSPPLTSQISDARDALISLGGDHGEEAERLVFLLNQAERIRLSILNLGRLSRRIGRAEEGKDAALALTHVLEAAGDALGNGHPEAFTEAARRFRTRDWGRGSKFFAALIRDAEHQVDALGGQLRTALGTVPRVSAAESQEPWRLRLWGRLAKLEANLALDSTVFRHALRLALCLGIGDALGRAASLQRTYWIPMTIAIVLKPDFTATFSRGVLRIMGTFAGLVLATALFHFVHTGVATDIVLLAVFTFLLRWIGPANYGIFVIALSALVVLLIATTGVSPQEVIVSRAINTAAGGALGMLAYAVWPTWERTQVGPVLAEMMEGYRAYFGAVVRALAGEGAAGLDGVRIAGRRARSNAEASVDRLGGEPRVPPAQLETLSAILVNSHSFVHAVMAMESGLYRTQPVAMRHATADFAAKADRVLAAIAESLRTSQPPPRDLPDLREAHNRIIGSPEALTSRYNLVNVETDRIVTSLNTLLDYLGAGQKNQSDAPLRERV